jgi:sigma-B regulation protein RsbU (phosphoserine phosphatase)
MNEPTGNPDRLQAENDRLRQAVEELSILNEIATAIDSSMKVDEINKLIVTKCIRRVGVEQGVIRLLDQSDPDQAFKTLVRVVDVSEDGLPFRLGLSLTGWIVKNQKPLLSNDLHTDDRFRGAAEEAPQIRSVLAVPLKTRSRMVGILSVFNKRDGKPFNAEDQRLMTIIATQSAQVIENARLQEEEAKLHVMEEDLRVARSIQESLTPKSAPKVDKLDLFGYTAPARQVGGDYYDWVPLSGGRVGSVVADVSGKGMPAALLMAQLQASFKAQAQLGFPPEQVVTTVNQFLANTMEPTRFVTLFYSVIDPANNQLTYANAGHNPALLWRADGKVEWLGEGGLMLSPVSMLPYDAFTVPFHPGDCLVVYTDGVTEAENATGAQFEEPALEKSVVGGPRTAAEEVGTRIKTAVQAFVAGAEQNDDITMAVILHTG